MIPDTLSRLDKPCACQNCSVTIFLDEIPSRAELMSITKIHNSLASITSLIWNNTDKGLEAVLHKPILNSLQADIGAVPFGNKRVWKDLQSSDHDCTTAINLITSGNVLPKKAKGRTINRLLRECCVNKQGLLVSRHFDPKILREIERIVVPQTYLHSLLCILHTKLLHPSNN